ncbi:facilitated trehalose transporter Tret1-like [Anticarsia gemmatalis]|uniref:facilitated trehalose transporter Tret1-like n=1 Tax=Anticarsia gemmatalis TaxID=129554 RepID=UPI003F76A94C
MKKFYFLFGEGSKVNQIICALLINLPVFAYGASVGWMSPMTLLLQSENSPRGVPLTDNEVSWMGAIAYLVCVPADFLMAILSDKFGRKFTMFFLSSMGFGCWVIKLSSMEPWAFVLARALVGMLMAGSYVTCPLYTKEISENSIRGMLGSLVIIFHTTGNLFLYIIGDILSYRTILWVCLSLPAIHLMLFTMMPESPSYLVKKGELEKAAKALAWLRCRREDDITVLNELDQIKKEQTNDEDSNKFALKAILSDKILFRAFKIALAVALAREFCGAIPVTNYAGEIFTMASEGTGLVLTPNQQAMMLGAVQVVGSALTFGTVEKAGRKTLLFITSLVSGLSMVALASWFLARAYNIHAPAWLPIATLCLCIFCDSYGLQPMSVIITGEIFSFKYRGTVMATAMASASTSAFLQMLFFKPIVSTIGIHVAFYSFGGVCLITALYAILVVPETKKKGLEEIYQSLKTKKEKLAEECEKKTKFEA